MNSDLGTVSSDCNSALRNSDATSSSFELQHFISYPLRLPKSCQCRNCPGSLVAPRSSHPRIPTHLDLILSGAVFAHSTLFLLFQNGILQEIGITGMIYIYIIWKHVYSYPFTGMPLYIAVYN